ncbi:hypothetical protein [Mitsuokella sp. oral taxon 131]|uniref:hypothetical protein n=1 Tax=Mitsuokella sp. oral taxon 131 TaxID=1321780 RepID=UPI00040445B7|nr:hypothetical protein [Mitsuokella sp. oral taxon 131]
MSEGKKQVDAETVLAKFDQQLEKFSAQLEHAEKEAERIKGKIKKLKETIAAIHAKRNAVIGEQIFALGYDNAKDLNRLYEMAKQEKEEKQMEEPREEGMIP